MGALKITTRHLNIRNYLRGTAPWAIFIAVGLLLSACREEEGWYHGAWRTKDFQMSIRTIPITFVHYEFSGESVTISEFGKSTQMDLRPFKLGSETYAIQHVDGEVRVPDLGYTLRMDPDLKDRLIVSGAKHYSVLRKCVYDTVGSIDLFAHCRKSQ